jgi:OOP family OmpA-OmpF porin
MKITKTISLLAVTGLLSISMYSCKTKKVVAKPNPVPVEKPAPVEQPKPAPAPEPEPEKAAPAPEPDFNFKNIQFEFNSDVLKTASFPILDKAVAEIKKDPTAKFVLNGNSSAEGTQARNMSLSIDRANAVKSYLVNAGLNAANFTVKGFGDTQPVASNATEAGRILNRRVEIKADK